jgi:uncharacterized iron-regulated protein
MAESLTAAGDPDGAILVAGASHVRNDYGIPVYLKANAREKTGDQPSLSLDKKPNRRVTLAYPDGRLPFDYLWFTARVDDEDACEKFKSQFDHLRKSE